MRKWIVKRKPFFTLCHLIISFNAWPLNDKDPFAYANMIYRPTVLLAAWKSTFNTDNVYEKVQIEKFTYPIHLSIIIQFTIDFIDSQIKLNQMSILHNKAYDKPHRWVNRNEYRIQAHRIAEHGQLDVCVWYIWQL